MKSLLIVFVELIYDQRLLLICSPQEDIHWYQIQRLWWSHIGIPPFIQSTGKSFIQKRTNSV